MQAKGDRSKRIRSANFIQDEKILLVRLIHKYGHAIVRKVSTTDSDTNKQKENEWKKITEMLNAARNSNRSTLSLKNLWCKLRIDTRTYKAMQQDDAASSSSVNKDPVLELVAQVTEDKDGPRNSHGWDIGVTVIDSTNASNNATDNTSTSFSEGLECNDTLNTVKQVDFAEDEVVMASKDSESDVSDDSEVMEDDEPEVELPPSNVKKQPTSLAANERAAVELVRAKLMCKLADEKLLTQRDKRKLVALQEEQMNELHNAKLENERLKKILLKNLIRKVKSGEMSAATKKATIEELLNIQSI